MPFTDAEKQNWLRERREAADKIEADRVRAFEEARRANAVATCIHCGNPFGLTEGIITDDVEMCYICLD